MSKTTPTDERSFDVALSRRVAEYPHVHAEMRDCFRNAARGALNGELIDDALVGAHYVEGWIVYLDLGVVTEHGWIELQDGRIVDPTAVLFSDDSIARYFPSTRYTRQQVIDLAFNARLTLPFVHENRPHAMDNPAHRDAHDRALAFARSLPEK